MSTRLYFTANAFSGGTFGSTQADANWNDISQCTTQSSDLGTTPSGDPFFNQTAQKNSGANPHSILHIRYKYSLPAGILFSGNIRGQHFGQTPLTLGAMRAISVRIFNTGNVNATLLQDFSSSLSSDFTATQTNRYFPPSTPMMTTYTSVANDILIVEVGVKWFVVNSGGTVTAGIRFGDVGVVDLPVDETAGVGTPEQNSWIEFENVDIIGSLDDPLPTFSASSVALRPPAPDKEGLQFFDRSTGIESIWNGTVWKEMPSAISVNGTTGIGGVIGFSDSFGVSVSITGQTVSWDAQALSVSGSRTRTLLLTDDGTAGALLTAANVFAANIVSLKAPNATNPVHFGKYGNIGMAGTVPSDTTLFNASKLDYSESVAVPTGMNFTLTNRHTGTVTAAARGIVSTVTASGADVTTGQFTNPVLGINMTVSGGAVGNTYFVGTVRGAQFTVQVAASATGTTASLLEGIRIVGVVTRNAVTDYVNFRATMPTVTLGGITNHYGMLVDNLTSGTNRWTIKGSQKFECATSDYQCTTTAKGLITKDAQSSPRFWRSTVDAIAGTTGGCTMAVDAAGFMTVTRPTGSTASVQFQIVDVGTAAPLT